MDNIQNILYAVMWFAILGGAMGVLLAVASKIFAVKTDERIEKISEHLPGANCGGCGYAGCAALAEAVAKGEAKPTACVAADDAANAAIAEIMGVAPEKTVRMTARVMCSGSSEASRKKFVYEGAVDCVTAAKLGGGSKLCPNGCMGLGTCVRACPFDAISVVDGVALVDREKCRACGKCVAVCPKNVIKLIPYDAKHFVGCNSADKGAVTRSSCDVGCIGCRICEKNCKQDAIHVDGALASIDYDKCTSCGDCVAKCPRKIIWADVNCRVAVKPEA